MNEMRLGVEMANGGNSQSVQRFVWCAFVNFR